MSAGFILMNARALGFVIATQQSMCDVMLFCVLICHADVGFSCVNLHRRWADVRFQPIKKA